VRASVDVDIHQVSSFRTTWPRRPGESCMSDRLQYAELIADHLDRVYVVDEIDIFKLN
jgi:hypothetical protein